MYDEMRDDPLDLLVMLAVEIEVCVCNDKYETSNKTYGTSQFLVKLHSTSLKPKKHCR